MAISSDSAKILFNIGKYNQDTSLTIPPESRENKLSLKFEKQLLPQLPNFDTGFVFVYFYLKIEFEGEQIYKNNNYDTVFSTSPTGYDIRVDVDASPEVVVDNKYITLILNSAGLPSNGKYKITAKYWYSTLNPSGWTSETVVFEANLFYERKLPKLVEWYDNELPELLIKDNEAYTLNGNQPNIETEFVLYPPKNKAKKVNVFDNIQTITYLDYWSGGNEVVYTAFITHTFDTHIIETVEQLYDSFIVYTMNWCATYECLNDLYNTASNKSCNAAEGSEAKEKLNQATALVQQIRIGLGCGKESLPRLIEELNLLLDCSCGCLDETPVRIGMDNVVDDGDIQFITALDDTTLIDLSKGSTIVVDMQATNNTTEIQISNILENGNYRFIFENNASQQPQMTVTFGTGVFLDSNGDMPNVVLSNPETVISEFYADTDTTLRLQSININQAGVSSVSAMDGVEVDNTDPINPVVKLNNQTIASLHLADNSVQELSEQNVVQSGSVVTIDFSLGNKVNLTLTGGSNVDIFATNVSVGERYQVIVKSSDSNPVTASFDDGSYEDSDGQISEVNIAAGKHAILNFVAIAGTYAPLTLVSRSDSSGLVDGVINIQSGDGISVDNTSPQYPVINLNNASIQAVNKANTALQTGSNISLLNNNAKYLDGTSQDLGVLSGANTINFANGSTAYIETVSSDLTLSASNFSLGKAYRVIIRKKGSGSNVVNFNSSNFMYLTQQITMSEFTILGVDLMAVNIQSSVKLVVVGIHNTTEPTPNVRLQTLNTNSASGAVNIDFSLDNQLFTFNASSNITLSTSDISGIKQGRVYVFVVRTGGSSVDVNFSSTPFKDASGNGFTETIAENRIASFTFVGTEDLYGSQKVLNLTSKIV